MSFYTREEYNKLKQSNSLPQNNNAAATGFYTREQYNNRVKSTQPQSNYAIEQPFTSQEAKKSFWGDGQNDKSTSLWDGVKSVLGASLNNTWGSAKSAVSTLGNSGLQLLQKAFDPEQKIDWELEKAKKDNGALRVWDAIGLSGQKNIDKGNEILAEAKKGTGNLGDVLLDVGFSGMQMLTDAALGFVTGGGSAASLASMGFRAFGSAAAEYDDKDQDHFDKLFAGVKSAGIELLTEKLGGFNKIYGKTLLGSTKPILQGVVQKANRNALTRTGLMMLQNFTEESMEEILSDILNPAVDYLSGLDKEAWQQQLGTPEGLSQVLYDGFVGGILGAVGAAPSIFNSKAAFNEKYKQVLSDGVKAGEENSLKGNSVGAKADAYDEEARAKNTAQPKAPSVAEQIVNDAVKAAKGTDADIQAKTPVNNAISEPLAQGDINTPPSMQNTDTAQTDGLNRQGIDETPSLITNQQKQASTPANTQTQQRRLSIQDVIRMPLPEYIPIGDHMERVGDFPDIFDMWEASEDDGYDYLDTDDMHPDEPLVDIFPSNRQGIDATLATIMPEAFNRFVRTKNGMQDIRLSDNDAIDIMEWERRNAEAANRRYDTKRKEAYQEQQREMEKEAKNARYYPPEEELMAREGVYQDLVAKAEEAYAEYIRNDKKRANKIDKKTYIRDYINAFYNRDKFQFDRNDTMDDYFEEMDYIANGNTPVEERLAYAKDKFPEDRWVIEGNQVVNDTNYGTKLMDEETGWDARTAQRIVDSKGNSDAFLSENDQKGKKFFDDRPETTGRNLYSDIDRPHKKSEVESAYSKDAFAANDKRVTKFSYREEDQTGSGSRIADPDKIKSMRRRRRWEGYLNKTTEEKEAMLEAENERLEKELEDIDRQSINIRRYREMSRNLEEDYELLRNELSKKQRDVNNLQALYEEAVENRNAGHNSYDIPEILNRLRAARASYNEVRTELDKAIERLDNNNAALYNAENGYDDRFKEFIEDSEALERKEADLTTEKYRIWGGQSSGRNIQAGGGYDGQGAGTGASGNGFSDGVDRRNSEFVNNERRRIEGKSQTGSNGNVLPSSDNVRLNKYRGTRRNDQNHVKYALNAKLSPTDKPGSKLLSLAKQFLGGTGKAEDIVTKYSAMTSIEKAVYKLNEKWLGSGYYVVGKGKSTSVADANFDSSSDLLGMKRNGNASEYVSSFSHESGHAIIHADNNAASYKYASGVLHDVILKAGRKSGITITDAQVENAIRVYGMKDAEAYLESKDRNTASENVKSYYDKFSAYPAYQARWSEEVLCHSLALDSYDDGHFRDMFPELFADGADLNAAKRFTDALRQGFRDQLVYDDLVDAEFFTELDGVADAFRNYEESDAAKVDKASTTLNTVMPMSRNGVEIVEAAWKTLDTVMPKEAQSSRVLRDDYDPHDFFLSGYDTKIIRNEIASLALERGMSETDFAVSALSDPALSKYQLTARKYMDTEMSLRDLSDNELLAMQDYDEQHYPDSFGDQSFNELSEERDEPDFDGSAAWANATEDERKRYDEAVKRREAERVAEEKARAKETFGDLYDKVAEVSDRISKVKLPTLTGSERFVEAATKSIEKYKKAIQGVVDGSASMQSLRDFYSGMKDNPLLSDYYSPRVEKALTKAAAVREVVSDEKVFNSTKANVRSDAYRAFAMIEHDFNRANAAIEMKAKLAENAFRNELKMNTKSKFFNSVVEWFTYKQLNPTTVFKMIDGFKRSESGVGYQLAKSVDKSTYVRQTSEVEAKEKLAEITKLDGWRDFAEGKTKVSIDGDEWSLLDAISFIGSINTLGGIDSERVKNANGFTVDDGDGNLTYYALDDDTVKAIKKNEATSGVDVKVIDLPKAYSSAREAVQNNSVAKAYMNAFRDMTVLQEHKLRPVYKAVNGIELETFKDGTYFPVHYKGFGNSIFANETENFFDDEHFLQERTKEEGGWISVRPVTMVADSYITSSCDYIAYAELGDTLDRLNKSSGVETGLADTLSDCFGEQAGKWLNRYANDVNHRENSTLLPNVVNDALRGARTRMQSGAVSLSASVPLKQAPSFFNAMGVLRPSSLWQAAPEFFKKPKTSANDPALLKYRKLHASDYSLSEVLENKDGFVYKLQNKSKVFKALMNASVAVDYKTISALYKATTIDVDADNPGLYQKDQAEFAQLVDEKFSEVVLNTQPVYTKNARAEYSRTNDEAVRMFSMFRTQQTQNLNRLITALGEANAAKDTDGYGKAKRDLGNTLKGQAASALTFALLSSVADVLLHKLKKYEDKDDNGNFDEILGRIAMNSFESSAATLWFGDSVSKWLIDTVSGGETNEFYGVSMGAVSQIGDIIDSIGWFAENPSLSNARYVVGYTATALGIPANNVYAILNAVVMDVKDIVDPGMKVEYDDMLKAFDGLMKENAKKNKKEAEAYAKFKEEFPEAEIKQDPYSIILGDIKAAKTNKPEEGSKFDTSGYKAVVDIILSGNLSTKDTDNLVKDNTSKAFSSTYDSFRILGLEPQEAVDTYKDIDDDGNMNLKQSELWEWYKQNPELEFIVAGIWNSKGYKKSWEEYKKSKH